FHLMNTYFQLRFMIVKNYWHVIRNRRERQTKARAFSQLALNFNSAAVLGNDLTDDHQAETRAVSSIFRRVKRIKNVTHHFGSHSRSGIDEINEDVLWLAMITLDRGANLNFAAFGHRIETVVNQIQKQLLQ